MAPHVCVVGAGPSGLRCASVLLEQSYDVTIIEARNRIGGRVRRHHSVLLRTLADDVQRLLKATKWDRCRSTCKQTASQKNPMLKRKSAEAQIGYTGTKVGF